MWIWSSAEVWRRWKYDEEFSFVFLNLDEVLKYLTPGKIAYS